MVGNKRENIKRKYLVEENSNGIINGSEKRYFKNWIKNDFEETGKNKKKKAKKNSPIEPKNKEI